MLLPVAGVSALPRSTRPIPSNWWYAQARVPASNRMMASGRYRYSQRNLGLTIRRRRDPFRRDGGDRRADGGATGGGGVPAAAGAGSEELYWARARAAAAG